MAYTLLNLADMLSNSVDEHDMYTLLAERSIELLEMNTTALLLINNRGLPRLVAAGGSAMTSEMLIEIQRVEGPCATSCQTGEVFEVENVAEYADTWPSFTSSVLAAGFRSVHSFPMAIGERNLGSLSLFSISARSLDKTEMAITRALTSTFTIALLQLRALREADEMAQQIQHALNKRTAVEQAKSMIARRMAVDIEVAGDLIKQFAVSSERGTSEIALDIVAGNIPLERVMRPSEDSSETSAPS
jgi:GAF domain-containing protein